MIARGRIAWVLPAVVVCALGAWAVFAYRELFARPFAADDYQWLLNVRGLSAAQLARTAFDPAAQTHFYRPLVWLLFWAQVRAFGLDPRGFHVVSLGLHLGNAALLGWLAYRLAKGEKPGEGIVSVAPLWGALLAGAIAALHPAPFEAVVWISAQSELLAAALLLLALHLWLNLWLTTAGRRAMSDRWWSAVGGRSSVAATLALALALLAKESAVIGLVLLALLGWGANPGTDAPRRRWFAPYLLPGLATLAYAALQVAVERRNYLLQGGGYGFGPQVVLNPLRSLALLAAPLAGTEHADAAWLVPVGALVALGLAGFMIYSLRRVLDPSFDRPSVPSASLRAGSGRRLVVNGWWSAVSGRWSVLLALAITLLPTAPFASPPDSRYLYLPALVAALMAGLAVGGLRNLPAAWGRPAGWLLAGAALLALAAGWWAGGELRAREARFAAGAGPGGSLWRLATELCAQQHPRRMLIVEPPLATPHAEAIVGLACGPGVKPLVVGRAQIADAPGEGTVVIGFPNGSAAVERTT